MSKKLHISLQSYVHPEFYWNSPALNRSQHRIDVRDFGNPVAACDGLSNSPDHHVSKRGKGSGLVTDAAISRDTHCSACVEALEILSAPVPQPFAYSPDLPLDINEHGVECVEDKTPDHTVSWSSGQDFVTLNGDFNIEDLQDLLDHFKSRIYR